MDVPSNQAVVLDSPPIISGSTNAGGDGVSQKQEPQTNMDSTSLTPRVETPVRAPPAPLGWVSQSARMYARPCRYGKLDCLWQFTYLDQTIVATHQVLGSRSTIPINAPRSTNLPPPKLSSAKRETFSVSSVEGPIFNIQKTFATPILRPHSKPGLLRFLKREPWADVRPDKLVCLGCGCDVGTRTPWSWIYHRNSCAGIDNAILRSVVEVWEAGVEGSGLIEEF
ncbi:hypothetical protein F5146DRAFT_650381 [Armillaria mellea]|nr:hypothetical protein F5146DRAFT_650381 [Armillaria mellea]